MGDHFLCAPPFTLCPASQRRGAPGHVGAWQPEPHAAPNRGQRHLLTLSRSVPGLCPPQATHCGDPDTRVCVCVYTCVCMCVCVCVCVCTYMHTYSSVRLQVSMAKLSLIDLAGSERATVTANRGERMREGSNINRSLLALGTASTLWPATRWVD